MFLLPDEQRAGPTVPRSPGGLGPGHRPGSEAASQMRSTRNLGPPLWALLSVSDRKPNPGWLKQKEEFVG